MEEATAVPLEEVRTFVVVSLVEDQFFKVVHLGYAFVAQLAVLQEVRFMVEKVAFVVGLKVEIALEEVLLLMVVV